MIRLDIKNQKHLIDRINGMEWLFTRQFCM